VTFGAFLAQLAFVNIIFLVAAVTFLRRLVIRDILLVTRTAQQLSVPPLQGEIRFLVLKCCRIESRDIEFSALVLGMTVLALPGLDPGDPTVKPLLFLDITGYPLMTRQA